MWVELTDLAKRPVLVNLDNTETVRHKIAGDPNDTGCVVIAVSGKTVVVLEPYEHVRELVMR